ncbi:MAG: SOS response-associated peptidase [Bacteroidota bacterium]
MCGRYTFTKVPDESLVVQPGQTAIPLSPRYNIAPSQMCAVIPQHDAMHIHYYRWGLIPHWAKDMRIGYKMINARSETLLEKASFKGPVRKARCVVLADGFYEWKKLPSGKQPYRIMMEDERAFVFAGLYARWRSPEGPDIWSFSIITTEPNELTMDIHDRMPVILDQPQQERWLNAGESAEDLLEILRPYPAEKMKAYPVSSAVGNVRNDYEELILPT